MTTKVKSDVMCFTLKPPAEDLYNSGNEETRVNNVCVCARVCMCVCVCVPVCVWQRETHRASLLRPTTLLFGRYAMWAWQNETKRTIRTKRVTTKTTPPPPPHPQEPEKLGYLSKEGHQVMFTQREQIDVLDNHHLVMVFIEDCVVQDICVTEILVISKMSSIHLKYFAVYFD